MIYFLTIGGVLVLRRKRPNAERPYRAWGYPVVPVLYMITSTLIMVILILYQTQDTWPGLVIVILDVPVYLLAAQRSCASAYLPASETGILEVFYMLLYSSDVRRQTKRVLG